MRDRFDPRDFGDLHALLSRRRRHVIWGARRGDVVVGSDVDLAIERLRKVQARRRRDFERRAAAAQQAIASAGIAATVAVEQATANLRRFGKTLRAIELEERAKAERRGRKSIRRGFEDRDA